MQKLHLLFFFLHVWNVEGWVRVNAENDIFTAGIIAADAVQLNPEGHDVDCDVSTKGRIRWSSYYDSLQVCNGEYWKPLNSQEHDGSTEEQAATSCLEIFRSHQHVSGWYYLKDAHNVPFRAWCDMDTSATGSGGGWTRIGFCDDEEEGEGCRPWDYLNGKNESTAESSGLAYQHPYDRIAHIADQPNAVLRIDLGPPRDMVEFRSIDGSWWPYENVAQVREFFKPSFGYSMKDLITIEGTFHAVSHHPDGLFVDSPFASINYLGGELPNNLCDGRSWGTFFGSNTVAGLGCCSEAYASHHSWYVNTHIFVREVQLPTERDGSLRGAAYSCSELQKNGTFFLRNPECGVFPVVCSVESDGTWTKISLQDGNSSSSEVLFENACDGQDGVMGYTANHCNGRSAYNVLRHPLDPFTVTCRQLKLNEPASTDWVVRLQMGVYVDYYRAKNGTLCDMLSGTQAHLWSSTPDGLFVEPPSGAFGAPDALGGSASGYPTDGRSTLGFWGVPSAVSGFNGGCCDDGSGFIGWGKGYSLWVRIP